MRLTVRHITRYQYDEPVPYSLLQVRLTPKTQAGQSILHWQTKVEGGRKELEFDDQHGNRVVLVSVDNDVRDLSIHSEGEVETTSGNGIFGEHTDNTPLWYFERDTALTEAGAQVKKLLDRLGNDFDGDIQRMHALSELILQTVSYETGKTHSETTAEQALASGHGVCQDHAHIFISAARALGFAARYVSGYLMMNDRVDQHASHAWAEVYLQDIGWVGFDVSNAISPDDRYVRIATGLDYKEAAPISGMRLGSSGASMIVSLQVQQ
jgi:transglutaminase-like putative cysteine protease